MRFTSGWQGRKVPGKRPSGRRQVLTLLKNYAESVATPLLGQKPASFY